MALQDQYSSIVSIIYFSVNFVFLCCLGIIVYKQGGHSVKSKSYLKDIWNQRKIYAPLIIHFYDTATDIGVIYNWHYLMQKEQNDDSIDYQSVDMTVFFWSGITFLIVYRICLLCWSLWEWLVDNDGEWYYVLLVLCDLYIFVAVYESFKAAQGIITENAAKRQRNAEAREKAREEKRKKEQQELELETGEKQEEASFASVEKEKEVEPAEKQFIIQLGEAMTESMPQIVLQSVFIIRSANEPLLKNSGSNVYLLLLSIIASLFSISNKFVTWDKNEKVFIDKALSLKPRAQFPGCVEYWYVIRVIWRMCQVISRFSVFVLVWTIMGGLWLPIWAALVWIYWIIVLVQIYDATKGEALLFGLFCSIASYMDKGEQKKNQIVFVCKSIECLIGFVVITIFGTVSFDCGASVCSNSVTRQIFNNRNERVLIFWSLGLISSVLDTILLFLMLRLGLLGH
eukprot:129037_1